MELKIHRNAEIPKGSMGKRGSKYDEVLAAMASPDWKIARMHTDPVTGKERPVGDAQECDSNAERSGLVAAMSKRFGRGSATTRSVIDKEDNKTKLLLVWRRK
jgi:hypothetical protein